MLFRMQIWEALKLTFEIADVTEANPTEQFYGRRANSTGDLAQLHIY